MLILDAVISDLRSILELQYLAYQEEAEILDNYEIPEMVETEEEIEEEFFNGIILKAVDDLGQIIGSIRAVEDEDTVKISKLIVDPNNRNKGVGSSLLEEIENRFSGKRLEGCTSNLIPANIDFYKKRGYTEFKSENVNPNVKYVFLEKF